MRSLRASLISSAIKITSCSFIGARFARTRTLARWKPAPPPRGAGERASEEFLGGGGPEGGVGQGGPALARVQVVVDLVPGEAQRVLLLEDHQAVEAIELSDVAGGHAPLALDPPEAVLRRQLVRSVEGLAIATLQLLVQVELLPPDGAGGAQPGEELVDQGVNGVRGHQTAVGDRHVKAPLEGEPLLDGQFRQDLVQLHYRL